MIAKQAILPTKNGEEPSSFLKSLLGYFILTNYSSFGKLLNEKENEQKKCRCLGRGMANKDVRRIIVHQPHPSFALVDRNAASQTQTATTR